MTKASLASLSEERPKAARTTMAAVLEQQNSPLAILELTIPPLQKGQVLVDLAYSGVCQTQLNEVRGHKGLDPYLPHTLGHEGSGTVLEVGEGVTKVRPGDRVVASWIKGKGLDAPSAFYVDENGRKIQSGAISTFLKRAIIAENRLIPISHSMPLREAALLGCAIPTGAGVVFHEMKLQANQSIAVFGVGGVGLSAILAAKAQGANPIVAIDIHDAKLEKAREMGATHVINAKTTNVERAVQEITKGAGLDFSLESAGVPQAMELAFKALKTPKGLCILAGNVPKNNLIQLDPFDFIRGKNLRGTWGGGSLIDEDVPFYANLYLKGKLALAPLISHEFPLSEINWFMTELAEGRAARGIVQL